MTNLIIPYKDELEVLTTTKSLVQNAQYVSINEGAIEKIIHLIENRLQRGLQTENAFTPQMHYVEDVQVLFFQNAVNFCFWAEKDTPKWQVEWPKGTIITGGEFGMMACFKRALAEGVPVTDALYWQNITKKQIAYFFRSSNQTEIPLLEKRRENLAEAGRVLDEKYNGQFIHVLEAAKYDVVNLVKLTAQEFLSFTDRVTINNSKVYFLKRAQFNASAISKLTYPGAKKINRTHLLTAFADYKIPQMLRKYGVILYKSDLSERIDSYILLPAGSTEEREIRASSIWALELIRQKIQKYTAAQIADALWLISQNQTDVKPYHRTRSSYY